MSDKQNRQPQTTVDIFQQFQNRTGRRGSSALVASRTATLLDYWLTRGQSRIIAAFPDRRKDLPIAVVLVAKTD